MVCVSTSVVICTIPYHSLGMKYRLGVEKILGCSIKKEEGLLNFLDVDDIAEVTCSNHKRLESSEDFDARRWEPKRILK